MKFSHLIGFAPNYTISLFWSKQGIQGNPRLSPVVIHGGSNPHYPDPFSGGILGGKNSGDTPGWNYRRRKTRMEYWDLYTKDRIKIDAIHRRGDPLREGEYHICVFAWIVNDRGEILVTRRHPDKTFPGKWDCPGGGLLAGEESIDGIVREVMEETGIRLDREKGELIWTAVMDEYIGDVWLFRKNVNIKDTKIQESEVTDIQWVTMNKLKEMERNNELPSPMTHNMDFLEQCINERRL